VTALDDDLATAEANLRTIESAAAQRRDRLAAAESGGLTIAELRELSDEVQLGDPAAVEQARIVVAQARVAALGAMHTARREDLPAATAALEAAEATYLSAVEAARQQLGVARQRCEIARASDVGFELGQAAQALASAKATAETASAARWRKLAGLPA
jgi:hypothetical protein